MILNLIPNLTVILHNDELGVTHEMDSRHGIIIKTLQSSLIHIDGSKKLSLNRLLKLRFECVSVDKTPGFY